MSHRLHRLFGIPHISHRLHRFLGLGILMVVLSNAIAIQSSSAQTPSSFEFSNGGGSDWSGGFYRPISITNATPMSIGAALTDYQIKVILTTATMG
ncbi:MAG: hypothetical protein QME51_11770, partial [Planctomycetota bacterium]|nr:hypothetical protein [Planctomycetota bacterium]